MCANSIVTECPCSVAGRTGLYFMCVTYGKVPNALCVCLWYIATHVLSVCECS